jgi:hypothetical protein
MQYTLHLPFFSSVLNNNTPSLQQKTNRTLNNQPVYQPFLLTPCSTHSSTLLLFSDPTSPAPTTITNLSTYMPMPMPVLIPLPNAIHHAYSTYKLLLSPTNLVSVLLNLSSLTLFPHTCLPCHITINYQLRVRNYCIILLQQSHIQLHTPNKHTSPHLSQYILILSHHPSLTLLYFTPLSIQLLLIAINYFVLPTNQHQKTHTTFLLQLHFCNTFIKASCSAIGHWATPSSLNLQLTYILTINQHHQHHFYAHSFQHVHQVILHHGLHLIITCIYNNSMYWMHTCFLASLLTNITL